jgi:hypothetical protein
LLTRNLHSQASIEYIRYLEDCVSKLQANHGDSGRPEANGQNNLPSIREFHPTFQGDAGDVEMSDSDAASPTFTARPDHQHPQYQQYQMQMHQHQPSVSPAIPSQDERHRQHSYSSVSTEYRHHSFSTSATTSPAFGPQLHGPSSYARSSTSTSASTLTSPALNPQNDLDQEATAALLMLNNDRRGQGVNARGLSVKDLLSA